MGFAAFDLSKTSTGWALWQIGWAKPQYGHFQVGSEYTKRGQCCIKLHQELEALHGIVTPFDVIFVEAPINYMMKGKNRDGTSKTSAKNIRLTLALAGHLESFAFAVGAPEPIEYSPDAWRYGFCGRDEVSLIKREVKDAQRSGRDPLKAAVMARCRVLGLDPKNHDEGDAIGVLTHGLLDSGIQPPWLASEVLRTPPAMPV
jgi:hypothetical protein